MISRLAPALAMVLNFPLAASADTWPEFRGRGDGQAPSARLPLTWSETHNIRWKAPIHGKGWSSPVVWGEQIWITTAPPDGCQMSALCVELGTGRIIHDVKLWEVPEPEFCHPMNSYATPTPAVEEGRVYVHFGTYGTACLDARTASVLWSRRDFPCNHHRGPASSPILVDDLVILTFDGFDVQYVVALEKRTGATVWKRDRNIDYGTTDGDRMKSYITPSVVRVAGRRELVSPSAGATVAYDPLTGRELWRVRSGGMNAAARPLYGHGLVYCTTAAGGLQLFAVRPGGSGDVSDNHVAWSYERSVPTRSSLLLIGRRLFMISDAGIASCLDALTGERIWERRIGGAFSASPVLAGGRMYFFSEDGQCPVIEASDRFKLLATNMLDEGCLASPAVVEDSLIVRTRTHLYRIAD